MDTNRIININIDDREQINELNKEPHACFYVPALNESVHIEPTTAVSEDTKLIETKSLISVNNPPGHSSEDQSADSFSISTDSPMSPDQMLSDMTITQWTIIRENLLQIHDEAFLTRILWTRECLEWEPQLEAVAQSLADRDEQTMGTIWDYFDRRRCGELRCDKWLSKMMHAFCSYYAKLNDRSAKPPNYRSLKPMMISLGHHVRKVINQMVGDKPVGVEQINIISKSDFCKNIIKYTSKAVVYLNESADEFKKKEIGYWTVIAESLCMICIDKSAYERMEKSLYGLIALYLYIPSGIIPPEEEEIRTKRYRHRRSRPIMNYKRSR